MPPVTLSSRERLERDITHTWRRLCRARRDGDGAAAESELKLIDSQLEAYLVVIR